MRYRLLPAVIGLLFCGTASAAPVPSDNAGFTAFALQKLKEIRPGLTATVTGPLTITFGPQQTMYLDRIYDYCQRVPDDCEAMLADYMAKSVDIEADLQIDATMLRAALRPKDYVDGIQGKFGGDPAARILARPFAGDLSEICLVDRPDTAAVVAQRTLDKLGLTEDAAFARCEANIAAALPFPDEVNGTTPPKRAGVLLGEFYESSLALLHAAWAPLAAKAGGALYIAVPAPQVVLYATTGDAAVIARLRAAAQDGVQTSDRPLSAQIFKWTTAGWEVVPP